jgi:long-subunit fatty acid transport protein
MTRYSNNQTLSVTGTLNGTALPNLPLNWKDMYVYRIGVEYTGIETIVLKAGFALVSPVTPKHDARATLTPPGTGKTITVGAGKSFMHDKVGIDAALEYSIVSASGSGSPSYFGDTTRELLRDSVSDYKAKSMALHIGANYRF